MAIRRIILLHLSICLCCISWALAEEGPFRGEDLLPRETKGFISAEDVEKVVANWERSELGKLFADPAMEPFVDDIRDQLDKRFATAGGRVGITISDLREVCSGEVCVAAIQPKDKTQKHAFVTLAYVEDRDEAVAKLLAKVDRTMAERKAVRQNVVLGEVEAVSYTVPVKKNSRRTFKTYIFVHNNWLVAADHPDVTTGILKNMKGMAEGASLADVDAFQVTMERCRQDAGELIPDVRWFVEPLGYSEVTREMSTGKRRRRTDFVAAMRNQGFEAVRGIGGFVNITHEHRDIEHRLFIYAPPIPGNPEKFELAARMLGFPLAGDLLAQNWVPPTVASYMSATWDLQGSYAYLGSLIDEVAGDEGFFEDLKDSLETDPNGPQINLDKEVVAHLGNRATVITDCQLPVEPTSERFLVAIDLTNSQKMSLSLEKALGTDPNVRRINFDGEVIWEIINEEEDYPEVSIEGVGGFGMEDEFEDEEEFDPLLSSAAISIVKGHLVISSHVEFVKDIMRFREGEPHLAEDADYQTIMRELELLGAADDCGRMFTRVDEEVQASYTLLREGRMPESQGLIGQMLNRMLAPEEEDDDREQKIKADELPDFQVVRRYLGTMGHFLHTEDNGWFVAGLSLPKDAQFREAEKEAVFTTAAAASALDEK